MFRYTRRDHDLTVDKNIQPLTFDPDFYPPFGSKKELTSEEPITLSTDFYPDDDAEEIITKKLEVQPVISHMIPQVTAPPYTPPLISQSMNPPAFPSPYVYYIPVYYSVPYFPYGMPYAPACPTPYTPMLTSPPQKIDDSLSY